MTWRMAVSARACGRARAARNAREEAEAYRLLYVALTRARDRLVLCGRRAERTDPDKIRGWWGAIREALADVGVKDAVRELEDAGGGKFRRYGDDPVMAGARAAAPTAKTALPAWAQAPVPAEAFARYASPSELG
jgi:ATP-dependent helicase/nuclease subunit A